MHMGLGYAILARRGNTVTPSPVPQKPFSTAFTMKVLSLVRARDIELLSLRNQFQKKEIPAEALQSALETADAKIFTDIMTAAESIYATLEATVDSVLRFQAQMQEIRALEAERIGKAV